MLVAAALVLACEKKPEPLREFPDIPAFPGSTLQTRTPRDTTKPATACFYRVKEIQWLDVQKFYVHWMPLWGWTPEEPPGAFDRDPHIYFSSGETMVAINSKSYAPREQYAVFKYRKGEAPAAAEEDGGGS